MKLTFLVTMHPKRFTNEILWVFQICWYFMKHTRSVTVICNKYTCVKLAAFVVSGDVMHSYLFNQLLGFCSMLSVQVMRSSKHKLIVWRHQLQRQCCRCDRQELSLFQQCQHPSDLHLFKKMNILRPKKMLSLNIYTQKYVNLFIKVKSSIKIKWMTGLII